MTARAPFEADVPAEGRVAHPAPDVLIAVAIAALVLLSSAIAVRAGSFDQRAAAPEIDRGIGTPVKVVPVVDLDSPLLKLGGKLDRAKLPDRWIKQKAKPRVENKAYPTPAAGTTQKDIPAPDTKIADAGAPPPPPDAEVAKEVDTPIDAGADAGPESNVPVAGHADGVEEGTETDPLKARAVDVYRARIIAWFSSRFRVSGSGLSQDQLTTLRVSASVQLGADRHVTGYSIVSSGNAAFDAAARATLEGAKGAQLPPPPENYPDIVQTSISLTFVCKEGRCD
jgi:outer membrane biosynthesis protein TonB